MLDRGFKQALDIIAKHSSKASPVQPESKLPERAQAAVPADRPKPTGGNPKNFCICGHHEMCHAAYEGMPAGCNQTGCDCYTYIPENVPADRDEFENTLREAMRGISPGDLGYQYAHVKTIAWRLWQAAPLSPKLNPFRSRCRSLRRSRAPSPIEVFFFMTSTRSALTGPPPMAHT